jgi:hypothetical protein
MPSSTFGPRESCGQRESPCSQSEERWLLDRQNMQQDLANLYKQQMDHQRVIASLQQKKSRYKRSYLQLRAEQEASEIKLSHAKKSSDQCKQL